MQSFSQFRNLDENFKNFIGVESKPDREIWADRVWELLQRTYAKIGGIKGNGFESKEAMINDIPFWKIFTRGENLLVAILYKEKAGRKSVAVATDRSPEAKAILTDVFRSGFKVSWGERSGGVLDFMLTKISLDVIRPFLLTPEQARVLLGVETQAITPSLLSKLERHDQTTYKKYQDIIGDYFYARVIGDKYYLKVALGTPHKTIS